MTEKEVCRCVPIEPIRRQVSKKYKHIKCGIGIHEATWNMYPCDRDKKDGCKNDHCIGKISFSISMPKDIKIITALFIREEKKGYVLLNRHLRSLFEEGLLDNVEYVEKKLNTPIIPLPVKFHGKAVGLSHFSRKGKR